MGMQITELHVGFQADGTERCILSLNPDRDTSASFQQKTGMIAINHKLTIWFYGVKRYEKIDPIFLQTKNAILNGTFGKWFK